MAIDDETRWAIDLDWLKTTGRSFSVLAMDTLCPKCRKKLKVDTTEAKASDLLKSIQHCCGKSPDYINASLPFQESIFRIFLANSNKPLTLQELGEKLNERRGIDTHRTSPAVLTRLMQNDKYYGFRGMTT